MKTLKVFKILLKIAVLILLIIGLVKITQYFNGVKTRINLNQSSVVKEIQSLNRFETASFTIEKIIEAETDGNIFQTILYGDKILLIAHAQIVAGVDFEKLESGDIKISGDKITITIPDTEILFSKLDNSQTRVYDRQSGFLTKGDPDLESQVRLAAENSILKAACDQNILEIAAENAIQQLESLMLISGFKSVEIKAKAGACF